MSDWRYLAQRFDGSGNLGDFVDFNLPLQQVSIDEVLSGDNSLSATITPEYSNLKGNDGEPIFNEWGICIWAEAPNGEVYGGILESSGFSGPDWSLECVDISGLLGDTPFTDGIAFENVDPIDMFRYIWTWYQSRPGCNFGLTADSTASPIRIGLGSLVQQVDFDTGDADPEDIEDVDLGPSSYKTQDDWVDKAVKKLGGKDSKDGWSKDQVRAALTKWLANGRASLGDAQKRIVDKAKKVLGKPPKNPSDDPPPPPTPTVPEDPPLVYQENPYRLNWYANHDLSSDANTLASETPFDWAITHRWSDEDDDADLQHHLRIGYPRLGRQITDLRFVLGENIHQLPDVDRDGEDYANEIHVIGNGEGAAAIHGQAYRPIPGRMRRTKTIVDTTITTIEGANARAEQEIASRATLESISQLVIIDHPHAPAGAVSLGDEFLLEGNTGWLDISMWVRCIGRNFSPDDGSQVTLTVVRTDRLA